VKHEGKFKGALMAAANIALRQFEAEHGRPADLYDADDVDRIHSTIRQSLKSRGWGAEVGHHGRSEAAIASAIASTAHTDT
jgi:hypothetical protein